jgi:hypothetical protein
MDRWPASQSDVGAYGGPQFGIGAGRRQRHLSRELVGKWSERGHVRELPPRRRAGGWVWVKPGW